jgi:AcrR family transcriptional regulator
VRDEGGHVVVVLELNVVDINANDIVLGVSRTGRRRGETRTREAIAAAARRQFGEHGYEETTIRSIATEAGVDPALVLQFFGSKDGLFTASIEWPFDPATEIAAVLDDDPANVGRRLVARFLETWDADSGRNPIVAQLRAATMREPAERQLREFLERDLLTPLVSALGGDQPALRANLVAIQLLGLGMARYVLRFQPLASLPPAQVVDLVGPAVQAALSGPLPGGSSATVEPT